MRVRAAVLEDAPALGRVMVEAWLSAHRDQMPDSVWQKRVDEWTPDVSARAWARLLSEQADGDHARVVLLVAEEDSGDPLALVLGTEAGDDDSSLALVLRTEAGDDDSGATAQIDALYVVPDRQGHGIGRRLLQDAAGELAPLGFSRLRIGVLSANLAARGFYEAMGGHQAGQRTFDEDGHPLPETVYEWSDLTALMGAGDQRA